MNKIKAGTIFNLSFGSSEEYSSNTYVALKSFNFQKEINKFLKNTDVSEIDFVYFLQTEKYILNVNFPLINLHLLFREQE